MKRLGFATVALGASVALGGCGTRLVFVDYTENLKPQLTNPPCPVGANEPIESQLRAGDGFRDQLLAPFVPPIASGRIDGGRVPGFIEEKRGQVQQALNDRYAQYWQAMACYNLAIEQDKSRSYAHLNQAVVNMRMADFISEEGEKSAYYSRAQNALSNALELNRYDGQTLYYQAELYARRRNYPMAEKTLTELLDKKWNRAHVHNLLGWIYLINNNKPSAIEQWTLATQIDRPASATEWAINNTHSPPRNKFENERDEDEPAAFFDWDFSLKEIKAAAKPPNSVCGWASNGKPRCGN